jgi:hypothetical protein
MVGYGSRTALPALRNVPAGTPHNRRSVCRDDSLSADADSLRKLNGIDTMFLQEHFLNFLDQDS